MTPTTAAIVWADIIVHYCSTAATAFLIWDVFITLDDEVNFVWLKPNSLRAKWLFLFIRYFTVAFQLSLTFDGTDIAARFRYTPHACKIWYIFQVLGAQLLIGSVEIVLILRVQALYLHNIVVTRALYSLFLVENTCMIIAFVFLIPDVEFDASCTVTHSPVGIAYFVAAFGAFETLLFIFTLVKFVREFREGWNDVPLLTVLVRDGTWAFALIFAALCVNAGFFLGAASKMSAAAFQWLLALESFAGARLILNLFALEISRDTGGGNVRTIQ